MSSIGVQHVVQNIHMIQHRTGTLGHAIQRVLRNMDINAGLALDQLIQAPQQGTAAGQGDAVVDDIGTQLRRGALQGLLDGTGDLDQALQQSLAHILRVDDDVLGQAVHQVAALDLHGQLRVQNVGGTDLDLDLLGGTLTETAYKYSLQFMLVLAITTVGTSYQMACDNGIIRGGGDTKFSAKMNIISMWLIVVPFSAMAAFWWKFPPVVVFFLLKWDQLYKIIPVAIRLHSWKWVKKVTRPDTAEG